MNDTIDIEIFDYKRWIIQRVKFSLLVTFQIPALLLSLLIFYIFLKNRAMLQIPQNCALLILLIVNFIQLSIVLSFSIHFYAIGSVSPALHTYCTLWTFVAYTLYVASEYLMATISVQRHILVFHGHILRIRWKLLLFHHFPHIFFIVYPLIFYVYTILIYPCDGTQWDYTNALCGFANCYLLYDKVLGTFDWAFNNGLPMLINALANALLVIRVINQKHQRQRLNWRKQRRMTIQLLCISSLYLVGWTPSLIVGLIQILANPTFLAEIQTTYFFELINIICLLLPWICVGLLPELSRWIKARCHIASRHNTVGVTGHRIQLTIRAHATDLHN